MGRLSERARDGITRIVEQHTAFVGVTRTTPGGIMSHLIPSSLAALLIAFAVGCGGRMVRPEVTAPAHRARSPRVIDRAEIATTPARNAEDLLQRARPQLLLPRAVRGRGLLLYATPVVYVDEVRQGGVEVLHHLPVHTIVEIVYLPAVDADRALVGLHPAGAIIIRTRATSSQ